MFINDNFQVLDEEPSKFSSSQRNFAFTWIKKRWFECSIELIF